MTTSSRGNLPDLGRYDSLVKFGIVGGVGIAVNEGLLLLLEKTGLFLLASSVIAIEISIITNFFLNDLWTFKDRRSGKMSHRLVKFNVLMLAGLVVNAAVLDAGVDYFGLTSAIANLVGIAVAFVIRYALSTKYAWMRTEEIETSETTATRPL